MKEKKPKDYEQIVRGVLFALMLVAAYFMVRGGSRMASTVSSPDVKVQEERPCVVIDAGHGGADPGKVSVDGSLEKDINLQIALKLQKFLQMQDIDVILTRESDAGLYDENASNKKVQDMKNRVALIEERQPALTVSIHQNSYHEEYVTGAQVFYYGTSQEGQRLAETLQKKLVSYVDPENHRQAKANESYYLLKKTEVPIVIVECGFLSNWEEAKKLQEDSYQNQIAWAVSMGILSYLEEGAE